MILGRMIKQVEQESRVAVTDAGRLSLSPRILSPRVTLTGSTTMLESETDSGHRIASGCRYIAEFGLTARIAANAHHTHHSCFFTFFTNTDRMQCWVGHTLSLLPVLITLVNYCHRKWACKTRRWGQRPRRSKTASQHQLDPSYPMLGPFYSPPPVGGSGWFAPALQASTQDASNIMVHSHLQQSFHTTVSAERDGNDTRLHASLMTVNMFRVNKNNFWDLTASVYPPPSSPSPYIPYLPSSSLPSPWRLGWGLWLKLRLVSSSSLSTVTRNDCLRKNIGVNVLHTVQSPVSGAQATAMTHKAVARTGSYIQLLIIFVY